MTRKTIQLIAGIVAAGFCAGAVALAAEAEKIMTVKEVMAKYHKAPQGTPTMARKVQDGKASKEEIKELVKAYTDVSKNKPPKGEETSWKDKTTKLVAAITALDKGEEGAMAKYNEAVNCMACHRAHRP
jgi:predicted patatin/cPLA2 family phospholipase